MKTKHNIKHISGINNKDLEKHKTWRKPISYFEHETKNNATS